MKTHWTNSENEFLTIEEKKEWIEHEEHIEDICISRNDENFRKFKEQYGL